MRSELYRAATAQPAENRAEQAERFNVFWLATEHGFTQTLGVAELAVCNADIASANSRLVEAGSIDTLPGFTVGLS
jgi:hypothetical protein